MNKARNEKCELTIAASVATAYTEAARDIQWRWEVEVKGAYTRHFTAGSISSRVRSASNVTVITRNLPRKLRVGKIENYP